MLSRVAERDVGAVGALLLWPSGVVQHGGVVLGPKFEAAHAFRDRIDGDGGYGDLLRVAHECSAVTAACLMTRRRDYLEAGGMDETHFPVTSTTSTIASSCARAGGASSSRRTPPDAPGIGEPRGSTTARSAGRASNASCEIFGPNGGAVLAADPYYNPILALDPNPFLRSGLAGPRHRPSRQSSADRACSRLPGYERAMAVLRCSSFQSDEVS